MEKNAASSCSVLTIIAYVDLTKKRVGHYAVLKFFSSYHQVSLVSIYIGSKDRASFQQLQMWFPEYFFGPKLATQFVMSIVSATVEQI